MIYNAFITLLESVIKRIRDTFDLKSKEYASVKDQFHNIKKAARRLDMTPEMVLRGFMEKHLTSLDDMILSNDVPSEDRVNEKIIDIIIYLILLMGIWHEKRQETNG